MSEKIDSKPTVKYAEIISGGRLTIPSEQRTKLGLETGDPVKVWVEGNQLHIEKVAV